MGIDHDAAPPVTMGNNADVSARLPPDVERLYGMIQRHTGGLGGNGSGGPIYGELAKGSMQKVVDKMIELTGLSTDSCVIDIGCELGKPSIHFSQYPGVAFSYGIEVERIRWMLGMANLDKVLEATNGDKARRNNVILVHGDVTKAYSLNPFTHIYMFDIG
jgi:hypothetical protein